MEQADMSDASLLAAVKRCRLCADLPLGPRPILQWNPTAPILIAGQAPGSRTHAKGIPFDDPSGERLRDWLGVDRATFYDSSLFAIVPMAFCFPGTAKGGDRPPPPLCAQTWRQGLLGRMQKVKLTIVLGHYAAAWHGGGKSESVTAAVSRWRETLPGLVTLPHPSPRNRHWLINNPWFEDELLVALKASVQSAIAATKL